MNITCFILKSKGNSQPDKVVDFIKDLTTIVNCECEQPFDINLVEKTTEWFLVMYDDEIMDEELKEAFRVLNDDIPYDVFILFRQVTEDKATYSPRLFRKNVKFKQEGLIPVDFDTMRSDYLLNGCIRSDAI